MRTTRRIAGAILAICFLGVSSITAQPYYVRGTFNGWDTSTPMLDNGGGFYSATFTGTPGIRFDFKVANADWSSGWPGGDARSIFNAAGSATVYFRAGSFADGWSPTENRVGYVDPAQFGWQLRARSTAGRHRSFRSLPWAAAFTRERTSSPTRAPTHSNSVKPAVGTSQLDSTSETPVET